MWDHVMWDLTEVNVDGISSFPSSTNTVTPL